MFFIPWLLGAAALAGARYIYKKYFAPRKESDKPNRSDEEKQEERNRSSYSPLKRRNQMIDDLRKAIESGEIKPDESSTRDNLSYTIPPKFQPVEDVYKSVIAIVNQIKFTKRNISAPQKIGEDLVPTSFPTGEIDILPMQNFSEIPMVLPQDLASEDEFFFANAASGNLHKMQPVERVGVYNEKFFRLRQLIRSVQDVSLSMVGQRIAYAKLLESLVSIKAQKSHADMTLRTFAGSPKDSTSALPSEQMTYNLVRSFVNGMRLYGDGTDINSALLYELQCIEEENKEFDKKHYPQNQILLVTDGTEGINEKVIVKKMEDNNVILHTVVLGRMHDQLKRVSTRFHYLEVEQDPSLDM